MQAILMAAGKGSRLGNMADGIPKSFVEIHGKKLIDINIHLLRQHGIKDIVIVTGCHAELFEEKFKDERDIHPVYNPFYGFTNVSGSFYMGMDSLKEDFIYMHADTLCAPSILEDCIKASGNIVLPVDSRPCDEEAMKVKCVDGSVRYINKRMPPEDCEGEFIGIAKLKAAILPDLKNATKQLLRREAFSEYFEAALEDLLETGKATAEIIDTRGRFWAEIDFREDYERAVKTIVPELYCF